ncbi:hypothetical protein [uncultured Treponema sp.]|uniref:hypothetical protein n=1 Tax=uncultured Treponema sp. TaxID=162155 RepID=UPI002594B4CB|nr:hypothetical protein [uncultured Treponema sp.]
MHTDQLMADIPVYAEKGKGGGIRISENYAIDKAVLTEREKLDVLAGIRTLSTISLENASGSGGKNDGTEKKQHSVTVPHKRRKNGLDSGRFCTLESERC